MPKATKKKSRRATAAPSIPTAPPETVLVLRLCKPDMTSHSNFIWPTSGPVECKDWSPKAECGSGLHGWLWGSGDHGVCGYFDGGKWLVVEVLATDVVDLGGKVKFPRGTVVHCGDQATATRFIADRMPAKLQGGKVIGGTASAGYRGTASAGYRGTASAGYLGTASAGDLGTASAGDRGTASAGYLGTASAGEEGIIVIRYYDDTDKRWRIAVGYPGEAGIVKGKKYRVKDRALVESEEDSDTKEAREYAAKLSKMKPADRG